LWEGLLGLKEGQIVIRPERGAGALRQLLELADAAQGELRVVAVAQPGRNLVLEVFAEIGGVAREQHRLATFELEQDGEVACGVARGFREGDTRAGAEVGRVQAKVLAGQRFIVECDTEGVSITQTPTIDSTRSLARAALRRAVG